MDNQKSMLHWRYKAQSGETSLIISLYRDFEQLYPWKA